MTENKPGELGKDEEAAFGTDNTEEAKTEEAVEEKEDKTDEEPEAGSLSDDPAERLNQIADLMAEQHGEEAPDANQLGLWKKQHKDIFILPVSDKTYVYRYLKRIEWTKMQTDERFENMNQLDIEEHIFDLCVLWPSFEPVEKLERAAGLVTTISEQIRLNSMFLNPEALAQMTIKL